MFIYDPIEVSISRKFGYHVKKDWEENVRKVLNGNLNLIKIK